LTVPVEDGWTLPSSRASVTCEASALPASSGETRHPSTLL
jgi:hypothetical protein